MTRLGLGHLLKGGLAILLVSGLAACGKKRENIPAPKIEIRRYAAQSAIVDYEVRGLKTGRERLYFDHWGGREARYVHTEMRMLGIPQEEHILEISDGEWHYAIDLPRSTGIRERNPLLKRYAEKIAPDGSLTLGEEMMEDLGGSKAGSNNILGRTCQIWVVPARYTEYCLWNNLPLLTVVRRGGLALITEAIHIEENVPVKNEIFAIPASIKIREPEADPEATPTSGI